VLKRLRARVDGGYDVVGFIDTTLARVGEKIAGVEILGSLETVGKVIDEHRVSEVVFSTDGLSYADILSAIARTSSRAVNFRMVPDSLEAILERPGSMSSRRCRWWISSTISRKPRTGRPNGSWMSPFRQLSCW